MSDAIVWTVLFFGVDLLVLLTLLGVAVRKDLQKSRGTASTED